MAYRDLEAGNGYNPQAFEAMPDELLRQGFIKKVYGTLSVQLAITAVVAMPIATASDDWLEANQFLMGLSLVGLLVFCCVSMCGGANSMFRKHPTNLFVLLGFTLCESVMVGFTCACYEAQSVLLVFGITAAIVVGLSIFAATTKFDATKYGSYFRAATMGLFVLGLMGFFLRISFFQLVYSYFGALIFAGYLVYDTQLIVGGKHQHCRFGVDDYAFAALSIYLDIIRLFMYLLRILAKQRSSRR